VIKRLDGLESRKADLEQELNAIETGDQQAAEAPASKKKDPKTEKDKAARAADQIRRKGELLRELDQLIRDSDTLLQDAGK
jgi:hypothetical protein